MAGIGRIRQIDAFILNLADCILEKPLFVTDLLVEIMITTASEKIFDFRIAKLL